MPRNRYRPQAPAFLAGTSTEFLGEKSHPRVLRSRAVVVILGPARVGKTSVALAIAGERAVRLDTHRVQEALLNRVREGRWHEMLTEAHTLVLDGPVWLRGRPGVVTLLAELIHSRAERDRRTIICQDDEDGSIAELVAVLRPGLLVTLGLRFPSGMRSKTRFAHRMCDRYGAPRDSVRGTAHLKPWRYEKVVEIVRRWPDPVRFEDEQCERWRRG